MQSIFALLFAAVAAVGASASGSDPKASPCGDGYQLHGYPGLNDTSGYRYCHNWNNGAATLFRTVAPGSQGAAECKALCDANPEQCHVYAKYGVFCDGSCDTDYETKCMLIYDCGGWGTNSSMSDMGAIYCENKARAPHPPTHCIAEGAECNPTSPSTGNSGCCKGDCGQNKDQSAYICCPPGKSALCPWNLAALQKPDETEHVLVAV